MELAPAEVKFLIVFPGSLLAGAELFEVFRSLRDVGEEFELDPPGVFTIDGYIKKHFIKPIPFQRFIRDLRLLLHLKLRPLHNPVGDLHTYNLKIILLSHIRVIIDSIVMVTIFEPVNLDHRWNLVLHIMHLENVPVSAIVALDDEEWMLDVFEVAESSLIVD